MADEIKTPWSKALDMQQISDGTFSLDFPPDYCYGTRAHGGLMTSLVMRAVKQHFSSSTSRPKLPDVVDHKVSFLKLAIPGPTSIKIEDLQLSKRSATVLVKLLQDDAVKSVHLVSVGDLSFRGSTFETGWRLNPPPLSADLSKLAADADTQWISYQTVWHPKSYYRILSHAKTFIPRWKHSNRTIRDIWLTPVDSDPNFGWTSDHIGYLADMVYSPLEEWQGKDGAGSHENLIKFAQSQGADRDAGKGVTAKNLPLSPITCYTVSMNIDIKKRLPAEGAKWIFSRVYSRQAKEGRMDWEITIHDQSLDLVAIVQVQHQIVDMAKNPMPGGTNKKTGLPNL